MSKNIKHNSKKPILLCILDGWGIGDEKSSFNAIAAAKTPNYDQILNNFPHSKLGTSGLDVGLPEGQMGNSEVGHISIGSGRIIFQDLPRINIAIQEKTLEKNSAIQKLTANCHRSGGFCHLLGLLSDGGVHSHQNHIIELAKIIAAQNIPVKIHAFLDGRDVAQKSAEKYIENFYEEISDFPNIRIATVSGRYYAMDRDNNWDRIKLAYNAIVEASGARADNALSYIHESYTQNITDEFIVPAAIDDYQGIKDGDALVVANFRSDRIREISTAILDYKFTAFNTRKIDLVSTISMTEYSEALNKYFSVLFPSVNIKDSLGEVLQDLSLKQLRVAETEKYAHVTFFFSGGREEKFKGEDRILIKSKDVATYDLLPEMAAPEIGEKLLTEIKSGNYDFIVVNYANADMVGHSGNFAAAVKACEAIDNQLGLLRDAILAVDGIMIVSADHGNIENMIDDHDNPNTAHTINPVPFILIGNDVKNYRLKNGKLCDIAPTILSLMNIEKPATMTGQNLIIK